MLELFLWKIKKDITITNAFQAILDESGRNASKIDKGSEFYNISMKSWPKEVYSTQNEGKSVLLKDLLEP